jgi:hypothetical protein
VYPSGVNATHPPFERLAEMPLWRLLVLLADIEREIGAASPTARLIARLVSERLRDDTPPPTVVQKGMPDVA